MDEKTVVRCIGDCVRQTKFNALVSVVLGALAYLTYTQSKEIKKLSSAVKELQLIERD